MKISILAVTIEFEDQHAAGPQPPPGPSDGRPYITTSFSIQNLLQNLIREAREGRNSEIWSNEPHGPIFKV